jgi:RNA polymerase sigma factor (TIGR02999 family)
MPEPELATIRYAAEAGDRRAGDRLFTLLYEELRRMAQRELRRGSATTLSPTTLLHETFLNISQRETLAFAHAGQFMSYAARAMRGLIIDHVRRRQTTKRGGQLQITSLPTELPGVLESDPALARIDDLNRALDALALVDSRLAECVDLKFFCGFSFGQIAEFRRVSERTVRRDWSKARVLLNALILEPEES